MTDDWTPAEARIWARRLRKVGFSPVTRHSEAADTATPGPGRWYLRCNWPFDLADLPLDLYRYFSHQDADDPDGRYEYWSAVHLVWGRAGAQGLRAQFREVRLGMGSRPIPAVDADRVPPFTTAGRVVATPRLHAMTPAYTTRLPRPARPPAPHRAMPQRVGIAGTRRR